jgi:hypothetical protein
MTSCFHTIGSRKSPRKSIGPLHLLSVIKIITLFTEFVNGPTDYACNSILFAPGAKTPKMGLVSAGEFISIPDNGLMGGKINGILYQITDTTFPLVTVLPYLCIGHTLITFIIAIFMCHCPYSLCIMKIGINLEQPY